MDDPLSLQYGQLLESPSKAGLDMGQFRSFGQTIKADSPARECLLQKKYPVVGVEFIDLLTKFYRLHRLLLGSKKFKFEDFKQIHKLCYGSFSIASFDGYGVSIPTPSSATFSGWH